MRPKIEQQFPGLELWLAYKPAAYYLLENEPRIIEREAIDPNNFAYIRELTCNMKDHPIASLCEESDIDYGNFGHNSDQSVEFQLSSQGSLPTKSLSKEQINKIRSQFGQDTPNANWIIGVENEQTVQAMLDGKKVTLVNTGIGAKFYKKMFPQINVLMHI